MRCPFCGHVEDRVVDSRTTQAGEVIRRRRECLDCERRYTTYERIEEVFPRIIKRDGSREDYDRTKISNGLRLSCSKRPISTAQLDAVVDRVEVRLLELGVREVESDWIGSCITEELRGLDPVAYIRFASVYRGFSDIEEFINELRELEASRQPEEKNSEE
ncbi:MAG: transcriptional regulator NrdR [Myxococcota bacterium]|jgi:transcriptional repressor NrdR|nr:transcriptional regulator NrdR [Myxococcota bacterium]